MLRALKYSKFSLAFSPLTRILAATILLASIWASTATASPEQTVLTGIDVLKRDGFQALAGQRIGLITNHTGVDADGISTAVLLQQSGNVNLLAMFSPEHGLFGKLDEQGIGDSRDEKSGVMVYSLYGSTRTPTREMLADIDTLVFDIQDIGTRFYTYISTMGEAMKSADRYGVKFVVLDRPNPINGITVSGPVLDKGKQSFVGFHRLPVRHGMTVGELARLFKAELNLELELEIIPMEGWQRAWYFDQTGLQWINPSPNMRNLNEAILYPGIGLLETTNLSVGRGTDTPFEWIGAPWIQADALVLALNDLMLPGIRFSAVAFTPDASKFAGQVCQGVGFTITNRDQFDPVRSGLEIALQLRRLFPNSWEIDKFDRLLGNQQALNAVKQMYSYSAIEKLLETDLTSFKERRKNYLIYP